MRTRPIRVLQFADVINRHDFIDTIVQHADPERFVVGACVRSLRSEIAEPVYAARTPRYLLEGTSRASVPRTALRLASLLRSFRADVLHAHHYDQAAIGFLATRLHRRTRLVLGRHYSDEIQRRAPGLRRATLLAVERVTHRGADRIVAPSTFIARLLREQGVPRGKIDLVPYGFDRTKYAAPDPDVVRRLRAELSPDGAFLVGAFSKLLAKKGHHYLIEAVAALRGQGQGLRLVVCGEGPERAALVSQARALGLESAVAFLGWRTDAMAVLAAVDAVVQPTLSEAFSQVMVEALWLGRPLVHTDVSGAPDVIADGVNGLLVPSADAPALARAIARLVTDEALRQRLGQQARASVEERLSIERIVPRLEQVYRRALDSRP